MNPVAGGSHRHRHQCAICTFAWWCGVPRVDGRCPVATPQRLMVPAPLCALCNGIALVQFAAASRQMQPRQVVALWRAVTRRLAS